MMQCARLIPLSQVTEINARALKLINDSILLISPENNLFFQLLSYAWLAGIKL